MANQRTLIVEVDARTDRLQRAVAELERRFRELRDRRDGEG